MHSIYLGICIQNNDPEMRGRIKIYIPQLAPTITKLNNTNVDKFFAFIGKETQNIELNNILEDLKNELPWAEYAGPICGGNASGRFNAFLNEGTTSDSNAWENGKPAEGFRPAQMLTSVQAYNDAFKQTGEHNNKFVNQYSYQYTPSNYSGLARGLFSIPNVGSHVYTFHINDDRNFPVYFASAYSQEDMKRIFTLDQDVNNNSSTDYPASYENIGKDINPTLNSDNKTFRSKTVLNSNKHTIELIDTDLKEIIKITHYSGSFKEFNNYATIELATKNDQKMVLGDQFLTIQKNKSEYIKHHNELLIGGDQYVNIGETNQDIVKQILNIYKELHQYKMLFDIQRAKYGELTTYGNPNDLSILQNRIPDNTANLPDYKEGFQKCPVCKGKPYDPYDPTYGIDLFDMWLNAPLFISPLCLKPVEITSETEQDVTPPPTIFSPPCHKVFSETMSPSEINPYCTPIPHPYKDKIGYYRGMKCQTCKGTGYSPSTEQGKFALENRKQPNGEMDQKILQKAPELFNLEKQLGIGGDKIETISMNKIETIGLVMNDMKSYRVDPIGKLKIDGCHVAPQGTYENLKPSPHVEYVDVFDIPGGDYNLTVMNKYKLLVGAKGINIQTHGPLDIYGTIVNFTGEQLNIGSKNEIVIDGGERLTLRARKVTVLPVEHNAFVVEGQLHVTRNTVIEGGIMLEGEVGLLHITAPLEWQQTEKGLYDLEPSCSIMATIDEVPTLISLPAHTHYFQNLPLTLLPQPEAVRESMILKGINSRQNIAAASRTTNQNSCSDEMWESVSKYFIRVAWNETKSRAAKEGFVLSTPRFTLYDSSYNNGIIPAAGPMKLKGSNCRRSDSESGVITTITATFLATLSTYSTYITVIGIVNEEGDLTGTPTIKK